TRRRTGSRRAPFRARSPRRRSRAPRAPTRAGPAWCRPFVVDSPAMRILVINADDLGFAPGVNRGIFEAHAAGTVTSASMMVTTPAFTAAAEEVLREAPRLGVGLHLN